MGETSTKFRPIGVEVWKGEGRKIRWKFGPGIFGKLPRGHTKTEDVSVEVWDPKPRKLRPLYPQKIRDSSRN